MEYQDKTIEDLMNRFKPAIGKDYEKYKNHVYRVFHYCRLIDNDDTRKEKYAIAAVFHDIGIWTDNTIDYLDPSVEQVKIYLLEALRSTWMEEITLMIYWHHKVTRYRGIHEKMVETFRKADWMDVSMALLTFGVNKEKMKELRHSFPDKGFHLFLIKKIGINFLKHPLNPLPMFKN